VIRELMRSESDEPINAQSLTLFTLKTLHFSNPIINIKLDAQFLFANMFYTHLIIAEQTGSNNPFEVLDCMPQLEILSLNINEWRGRIERLPDLIKLRSLTLTLTNVEVAANAFDHLTGLESLIIYTYKGMETFETGIAPRYLYCGGDFKLVKLNSKYLSKIEELHVSGSMRIESSLPLVGVTTLHFTLAQKAFLKAIVISLFQY
jgi:hypothetical protein